MVHLDSGVADIRGLGFWHYLCYKRGGSESSIREALTEVLIGLTVVEVDRMDSTTNKRKETNINSGVVL